MIRWLWRKWLGYKACRVPTCWKHRTKRGLGLSAWCDDHTDAIYADSAHDWGIEPALRVGHRRWRLLAEIALVQEIASEEVLRQIVYEVIPQGRDFPANRAAWDRGQPKLSPRVDELLELFACNAEASSPPADPRLVNMKEIS
jgi:hypothetical protein